ncbi:hypothetical protein F4V57_12300 [Acinetobacter qingfengensis]|uniref:Pilus assembly protein PilY n=1 Tax=Acinetobacter qingfengensis TaxID=1262585 RepID=A0A1E7QXL5_9GAMM|nr:hypothetical protein [Acinetobacter qingfengensis]KAA8731690.1 hypothetical protein F4V57_12300 [Acinetobacter qingfengensis]OEY91791.1 hypothetical protein BJI46_06550 [Acinetobacter qingfengensis]
MKKIKFIKNTALCRKSLAIAIATSIMSIGLVPIQITTASDMEIYQNPSVQGKTIIMLMLDTSWSMYNNKDAGPNSNERRSAVMERSISLILNGGTDDNGNTVTALDDDVIVGFSMFANSVYGPGAVVIPARPLSTSVTDPISGGTITQRALILKAMTYSTSSPSSQLQPNYSATTPTVNLYAETAAYLLGTTTLGTSTTQSSGGKRNTAIGNDMTSSSTFQNSGFDYSQSTTKSGSVYSPPLTAQISDDDTRQCSAQGIFYFTDGTPTLITPTQALPLLQNSLSQSSYDSTFSCDSSLLNTVYYTTGNQTNKAGAYTPFSNSQDNSNLEDRSALTCIGNFAQRLVNKTALTATPLDKRIYTYVVGFGADFKNNTTNWLVAKEIRKWGYIGMNGSLDDYDNPTSVTGLTTTSGFTVANDTAGIATAMSDFVSQLQTTSFDAASFGTYVVPKDPFDTDSSYSYTNSGDTVYPVFAPQFQPNISAGNSTKQLWLGNLKKYQIVSGVIKDSTGTTLLDDDSQVVSSTHDFWNAGSSSDGSSALLGGSLSRLITPDASSQTTAANVTTRPLWIDASITSGKLSAANSLTKLTTANVLTASYTDTADTNYSSSDSSTYWRANKYQPYLLSALGYQLLKNTLTGYTAIKTWTQFSDVSSLSTGSQMGAIVHSDPILVTLSGTYDSDSGTYTDRSDYVVFGSMQGILHMVNQSTGKEVFAFLPNEILQDSTTTDGTTTTSTGGRRDALLNQDNTVRSTTLPYSGLDAPWNVWTEYAAGSNNTFSATVANIYGGMRMGGNSYYGINVLDPTNPKFLFQIDPINGTIKSSSSVTVTTAQQAALQAMGQSWSKPTLAKIRYNNEIRKVMIVGGGYDTAYEDTGYVPQKSLGTTTTTSTQTSDPVVTTTTGSTTTTTTPTSTTTTSYVTSNTGAGTTTATSSTSTTTSTSDPVTTTSISGNTTTTTTETTVTTVATTPITETKISYSNANSNSCQGGGRRSCYLKTTTTSTYNQIVTTVETTTSVVTTTTTSTTTTNTSNKGAGVYIFDAETGELIWDARFGSSSTAAGEIKSPNMQYSVVSQIKAEDRNNDGLADHLYFGDLGGQVWRVDLNNTYGTAKVSFAELTRLADFSSQYQRFYEMPTFTIHTDSNGRFAAIALASGNRSRPLDETNTYNNRLYVLFDHDVTSNSLYSSSYTKTLQNAAESNLVAFSGLGTAATTAFTNKTKAGWYYELTNTGTSTSYSNGTVKALGPYVALASGGNYSDLYVSLYNPEESSSNQPTTCTGGITGVTTSAQFCLPYGICSGATSGGIVFTKMGDGIQKLNAATYSNGSSTVSGILNVSTSTNTSGTSNSTYTQIKQFKPLRWFNQSVVE